MGEHRAPPQFERVATTRGRKADSPIKDSVVSIKRAFTGDSGEGFTLKASGGPSRGDPTYSATTSYTPSPPRASRGAASGGGVSWLPVALGLAAIVAVAFRRQILAFFGVGRAERKGRWIRDRSLGGKMVFVADDDDDAAAAGPKAPRPGALGPIEPENRAPGRAVGGGATAAAEASGRGGAVRPEWWTYVPPLPVSPGRQLECRKRAKRILKQLENEKLLQGRDYDTLSLVQLYNTCKEGDVDVATAVATDAGRDAILRHAVQDCLAAAGRGRSVSGVPAREFICGLSRCLGVAEKRAVTIVHAATAAQLRGVLLAIAAAQRGGGGEARVQEEVERLLRIVEAFPMPDDAPEPQMVGTAMQTKFTTSEMQSLLKGLAMRSTKRMGLFTSLLGFDPALTLPMLEAYVAEQQQGGGGIGGGGEADAGGAAS